jgi:hypothetical protein
LFREAPSIKKFIVTNCLPEFSEAVKGTRRKSRNVIDSKHSFITPQMLSFQNGDSAKNEGK